MALFLPSPPSHQCRMTDSNSVPCLKQVAGLQPVPSSIKKAISTVGSGHRNVSLWHAESRPTQGPRLRVVWRKLVLSSTVLYRHREELGPGVFEDRSSFYFSNGILEQAQQKTSSFSLLLPPSSASLSAALLCSFRSVILER